MPKKFVHHQHRAERVRESCMSCGEETDRRVTELADSSQPIQRLRRQCRLECWVESLRQFFKSDTTMDRVVKVAEFFGGR